MGSDIGTVRGKVPRVWGNGSPECHCGAGIGRKPGPQIRKIRKTWSSEKYGGYGAILLVHGWEGLDVRASVPRLQNF